MSSKKNKMQVFEFLPIVNELLRQITTAETNEKDIQNTINKFYKNMEEAQQILRNTSGLDLTEEEQERKLKELEAIIAQKQHLIDECTKFLEEWNNEA